MVGSRERARGLGVGAPAVLLVVLLMLMMLISSLVPFVRAFAPITAKTTATTTATASTLSPLEELLLRPRLETIRESIRNEYAPLIRSALDECFDSSPESSSSSTSTSTSCCCCCCCCMATFVFPGAGGVDDLVLEVCEAIPNAHVIDWKEHRGTLLTAGYDSESVGEAVAGVVRDRLLQQKLDLNSNSNSHSDEPFSTTDTSKQLTSCLCCSGVRFVGISVGGFAANAACTLLHKALQNEHSNNSNSNSNSNSNDNYKPPDVHLVLLDPFCGRGISGPNYGRDRFGTHATTAIQILNTDDPVPTTNDPLPHCYCLDVTGAPQKYDGNFVLLPGDSMHSWPVAYFARHFYGKEGCYRDGPDLTPERFPRGIVVEAK